MRRWLVCERATLRPRPIAFKQAIAQSLQTHVWPHLSSGAIRPVIYKTLSALEEGDLSGAAQAHALMESNQHVGKIVLTWNP